MLIPLNGFEKEGEVYVQPHMDEFAYSDGASVEQYLKAVVESAGDLSSFSPELERAIQDWATEYHLSSRRANLLRGFDFRNIGKVLELGCGCGAITRFLGEQGVEVDAVEGSAERAEIAALRCRDLPNVKVYRGNFNKLDLPQRQYDLICLIGVAEYAARFGESQGDMPVVDLLSRLKGTLAAGGAIVLAIENRTGMKYMFGAHEDHYAKRFVGLNNYFDEKDINTYTLPEWNRIFRLLDVKSRKLYFPFPDYKLPTVLLSEEYTRGNPFAFCHLEGVESRDYIDIFRPPVRESLIWQGAAASDTLGRHANSFLFVFSPDAPGISPDFRLDFAQLPGFRRRREYCLVAVKPEGEDVVRRRKLVERTGDGSLVSQRIVEEPFHSGVLLSVLWARALELDPYSDRFVDLVRKYTAYLYERDDLSIDLIPSNIVVGEDGTLRAFDEEWAVDKEVTVELLLFRALVTLVVESGSAVRGYAQWRDLVTGKDFIVHIGDVVDVNIGDRIDEFLEFEEAFQNAIAEDRRGNHTRELLEKLIAEHDDGRDAPVSVEPRVYWREAGEAYSEERMQSVVIENNDDVRTVRLMLRPEAGLAGELRFNPCREIDDGIGFMRIYRLALSVIDPGTQERTVIWALTGAEDIVEYTRMRGVRYSRSGLGSVFMVTDEDPSFEFALIPRRRPSGSEYLEFEAEMRLPRNAEYLLAKDRYLQTLEILEAERRDMAQVYETFNRTQEELRAIKRSTFWKAVTRYRRLHHTLEVPVEKVRFWLSLVHKLGMRRAASRGWRRVLERLRTATGRTPETPGPPTGYEVWRETHLDRRTEAVANGPLISVVMPVHNVDAAVLEKALGSLRRQTYGNWELCIADDASDNRETLEALGRLKDERFRVTYLSTNVNIAAATNAAAGQARGEYLAFMDNDDELPDNALYEVAAAVLRDGADCIYTDEDFIKTDNHLDFPHFKPDYNPDLLLSHNYITHLLVVKRELFDEVGGLRSEYDGAQDYDLVLRLVEKAEKIVHIPKPLYHWRMSARSTSLNPTIKPEGHGNARKALQAALERRGIDAVVEDGNLHHYFRVRRAVTGSPLVSIIVPFRDKPDLLKLCLRSIIDRSTHANYEILGISNDSYNSVTYEAMEELRATDSRIGFRELNTDFNFSRIVNFGVKEASGRHIILLNNDIEIISADWMESLLEHSQRAEVAAVGAKLYYPNNTIQHAGLAIGLGGYAGHLHKNFRADSPGYFNRLNVIQDVSAVTGALMMVERARYIDLGGFDEVDFGVAYNDVDFCLRARENGYLNVLTPYVEAYHHESVSRGYEDTSDRRERFEREKRSLRERHGAALDRGDPYYNPNFDQGRDDFRLPR